MEVLLERRAESSVCAHEEKTNRRRPSEFSLCSSNKKRSKTKEMNLKKKLEEQCHLLVHT